MSKNQLKVLVLGVIISLLLCGGASAATVNNNIHLSTMNDLKTVNTNFTIVKKDYINKKILTRNYSKN